MKSSITRKISSLALGVTLGALAGLAAVAPAAQAEPLSKLRLDYAYYNPLSLVLKEQGRVERAFADDKVAVEWVLSLGSNKALEFLNGSSIDVGSAAGAAALLGRIAENPIKIVYIFSKPEWTALVTRADSPVKTLADLKGKRIAVTRGTDPHIFLLRALGQAGLTARDVTPVLLQHPDGKAALERGDVDAWAGLDPYMAQAEEDFGARLVFRNADLNTYGTLNVREAFAAEHPEAVVKLIRAYEEARAWAIANPDGLKAILAKAAKLTDPVAARQLTRTDLTHAVPDAALQDTLQAAGEALKSSGVIAGDVDVAAQLKALIEPRFAREVVPSKAAAQ